jgi:hypothetical protein
LIPLSAARILTRWRKLVARNEIVVFRYLTNQCAEKPRRVIAIQVPLGAKKRPKPFFAPEEISVV